MEDLSREGRIVRAIYHLLSPTWEAFTHRTRDHFLSPGEPFDLRTAEIWDLWTQEEQAGNRWTSSAFLYARKQFRLVFPSLSAFIDTEPVPHDTFRLFMSTMLYSPPDYVQLEHCWATRYDTYWTRALTDYCGGVIECETAAQHQAMQAAAIITAFRRSELHLIIMPGHHRPALEDARLRVSGLGIQSRFARGFLVKFQWPEGDFDQIVVPPVEEDLVRTNRLSADRKSNPFHFDWELARDSIYVYPQNKTNPFCPAQGTGITRA